MTTSAPIAKGELTTETLRERRVGPASRTIVPHEDPALHQEPGHDLGSKRLASKVRHVQNGPEKLIKRRRHVVNRPLQFRLMAFSLVYALMTVVVMAASLFLPLVSALKSGSQDPYEAFETATNLIFLHERLWPALLLSLLAICLHTLWVSHKIAGPLYRFTQLFKCASQGELPRPTRLRRGDLLKPEMERINIMFTHLRQNVSGIHDAEKELSQVIEALPSHELSPQMRAALRTASARLEEAVSKLSLK